MARVGVAAGVLAVVLLAGCPQRAPVAEDLSVRLERVASGLTSPVALAALPDDGGLLVATQPGVVVLIPRGGAPLDEPYLDVSGQIIGGSERGLLGLALHPDFDQNGRLFLFYAAPKDDLGGELRVAEFHAADPRGTTADADSERVLLRQDTPQANHNGGQLAFGPDGMLYISIGDGGGGGDTGDGHTEPGGNAQDLSVLHGKILRIDVDGDAPYAVPADNPFVGVADVRAEIYAYGLRNPWRFSFDACEGGTERLFVGDVGQSSREEVDIVEAGGNYGWRIREGAACFNPRTDCGDTAADGAALIDPILDYGHDEGVSVIGGFVYRGDAIPALRGKYVFGDLTASFLAADGSLFVATESAAGAWTRETLPIAGSPSDRIDRLILSFGQDNEGELYVLTSAGFGAAGAGEVWKLVTP